MNKDTIETLNIKDSRPRGVALHASKIRREPIVMMVNTEKKFNDFIRHHGLIYNINDRSGKPFVVVTNHILLGIKGTSISKDTLEELTNSIITFLPDTPSAKITDIRNLPTIELTMELQRRGYHVCKGIKKSMDDYTKGKIVAIPISKEEPNLADDIKTLGLSSRTINCLRKINKTNVADLIGLTHRDILLIKNLGRKGHEEIIGQQNYLRRIFNVVKGE